MAFSVFMMGDEAGSILYDPREDTTGVNTTWRRKTRTPEGKPEEDYDNI